MAKKLEYQITTDASQGIQGVNKYAAAVKRAMKDVEGSTEDTTTQAQKLAKAYSKLADELEVEFKASTKAADALGKALGPDLADGADVHKLVDGLHRAGAEFDDITNHADELAASFKKIDAATKDVGGIGESSRRAASGVDEIGKSANSSKGALANMIGNSAQDLGNLGGVAGSAGVAVGQMAEYFADAALEGEALSAVAASFATVVGPIAALSLGIGLVTSALSAASEEQKRVSENSKAIADDISSSFEEINTAADLGLSAPIDLLDELALGFVKTQETSGLTIKQLVALGLAVTDLGTVLKQVDTTEGFTTWAADFLKTSPKVIGLTGDMADQIAGFIAEGENFGDVLNLATSRADQATIDWIKSNKDLIVQLEQINDAGDDFDLDETIKETTKQLLKSKGGLEAYLQALTELGPGASSFDLINRAIEIYNGNLDKAAETTRRFAQTSADLQKWVDRTIQQIEDSRAAFISLTDAQTDLTDFNSVFNEMARSATALGQAFDLGNAPIEFLDHITDIHDGMRDLAEFVNSKDGLKGKIPNIFNPNDVKAGPFLQKIQSLRGPIQQQIIDAFSTGGAPAAQATADQFVNELFQVLGGKISKGDIAALVGIDSLDVKFKIGIDAKSKAEFEHDMELLVGLQGGETPWTAAIKLAVESGQLSAAAGKILSDQDLVKQGIPVALLPTAPTDQASRAAAAEASAFFEKNKATLSAIIPSNVATPTNQQQTVTDVQSFFDKKSSWINIYTQVVPPPGIAAPGRSSAVPPVSGFPGTRTAAPAGVQMMSTAPAATTSSTSSQQVVAPNVNITVNGATGMNRFELMRVMRRSNQDLVRLMGRRG